MTAQRRSFQRETADKRRDDLIAAAVALVAESGAEAATTRAIAARAGVTPGLIRHYFATKEALTGAAYGHVIGRMTEAVTQALGAAPPDPAARLAAFVVANFSPPVLDPVTLAVWAGFMQRLRLDPALRAAHEGGYLAFRDRLQALIAALPGRGADPARDRSDAIACNALIDGLWIEAIALPHAFAPGEAARIALAGVSALLSHPLFPPFPLPE